ncbi:MAG TPA: phytanoyl-CoA dioxygenase family protein [Hymenobacter sp.]|uniref:phytanoyl-CoA dioxygenase family protein n=1 Tax=Hymenobacter sp. TaxID=1898978 RepID=UPI002D7E5B13|nr:phytanoyl-CoA dioxygenase family protein [Hymenobacter sp.]HET9503732.1 phytanoyl-CoA dioxygenase family protein [Hymenobacter sp.]
MTFELATAGHATLPALYTAAEVAALLRCLESAPAAGPNFRRSQDVFAIRHLLGEVPALWPLLATSALRGLLHELLPAGCHLTKAIYFDKPAGSNWLVAWHQDLMINVDRRAADLPGFGPWTAKAGWVAVQPPVEVLENTVTIRLHLDDCDATNGALKVVPGSHLGGVAPAETIAARTASATVCTVPAGGAMLMKPLLHASNRSTSSRPRRVIHLEFSAAELPSGLAWRERREIV